MANSILNTLGLLFLNDSFFLNDWSSSWKRSSLPNDPKRPQVTVRGWGEVVFDESPIPTRELNSLKGWMKVQEKRSIYVVCGPLPLTATTRIIIYMFTREIYKFHTAFWKKNCWKNGNESTNLWKDILPIPIISTKKWSEGSCPHCDVFPSEKPSGKFYHWNPKGLK